MAGGGGLNDLNAIRGGNGAAIYNYGLWDAQSDQTFNDAFGGATVFNNSGVVRKSAGAGNTIFAGGVLFNQTSGGSVTSSGTGTTYLNAGNFNIVGTAGSLTPSHPRRRSGSPTVPVRVCHRRTKCAKMALMAQLG